MPLSPGVVICSRYKIARLLGEGGFGAVYLAEDLRLGGKTVAVKEGFDRSQEAQEQFRLEAQLLANLQHAGLPRVTDHFLEPDGCQYLVMDYIEGDDLSERVINAKKPLSEREALAIMLQVCEAVEYLHARSPQPIIHRDIKPPNIKITRDGRAILVDFGIAKLYHPSKKTARVAKAVTPHFSSPEQYVGKTDARSDVYSLGATLYCLVCAAVPPDAMDRLTQNIPLLPARRLNPAVSQSMEHILVRSLELDPNRRFQNAGELAAALRNLRAGQFASYVAPQPVQITPAQGPVCPRCGKLNRVGARFCSQDGVALPAATPVLDAEASSPEMLFEIANAYARNENYSEAVPRYERCLSIGFTDPALYHNLGLSYLLSNQPRRAVEVLEKGVALHPQDADTHYQLARAYFRMDLNEQALVAAAHACQLSPKEPAHYWLNGHILFELKRYTQAVDQFERCTQLDPNDHASYVMLGRAYGESGNLGRAVSILQQAARKKPSDAEPHVWIGLFYARNKKCREAAPALEKALRINPDLEPAHYILGQVWLDQDKPDKALPHFQRAVELDPKDGDNHARVALCLALLNRKTEAITAARQALSLNPQNQLALEIIRRI